ncbi:hypothetical protein L6452_22185 [Arctium lappa]|uniref:Uncharacterized protein n=1 Tax=Arctium lappa TaxID=4217 RepID=A0ACB9AZG2_ARCLA|nr:hypothetical protein L6452_22185 [Arctium lappa]
MAALAKTLALMTRQFNRGLKKPEYRGREERDDRSRGYGEARRLGREETEEQGKKKGVDRAECRSSANKGKPTRDAAFYKKKAEYYTQRSLMVEQENLETDESSDEDNTLFCGKAEVHFSDNESEVSTSNSCNSDFENKLFEIQIDLLAYKNTCSNLEKKIAFFERETRLLTKEKDKLYLENKTLTSEHTSIKKGFKEKISNLDKALKEKVKELKKCESDCLNAISLKNVFQKEREALHRDLFDRDLKIKKYQDAQKITEKVNTQIGRRGIGFDDVDPYTGNKRNKSFKKQHVPIWYLDSGCSRHMTGDRGLLSSYKEKLGGGSVTFGDNKKGQIKGYGVIAKGDIDVNRVAYVDGLKHNLLSVSQLCDNGLDEMFKRHEFEMSIMGELTFFLGLQVKQTTEGIFINQSKYVSDILEKYKLSDSSPMKTPMVTGSSLHADPEGKSLECKLYRGMIGSLLYLKGTKNLGLWYPENSGFDLMAYIDSDYEGCKLDRKIMWMRTQLRDYGFDIEKIPILCDSKSAIAISANPVQHSKTKHIDIRYHFLKHHVEHGTIEMYFVPTDYQLVDHFTKALDEKRFTFLVGKIGMLNMS